jgi:hypothetical protein
MYHSICICTYIVYWLFMLLQLIFLLLEKQETLEKNYNLYASVECKGCAYRRSPKNWKIFFRGKELEDFGTKTFYNIIFYLKI